MTSKERNRRKIEILGLMAGQGDWLSSYEIAEALGLSWSNSSNLLRRYSNYGLARRRRVVPEVGISYHLYSLSVKGRKRLAWLRGHNLVQIQLPVRIDRLKVMAPRVVRVINPNILRRKE